MHDWRDDIDVNRDRPDGGDALDRALAALASADEALAPSPALPARVLAAWDGERAAARGPSRAAARRDRPHWRPAVAGLSVAAAVVLALVLPRPRPAPHPIRPQQQGAPTPAPLVAATFAPLAGASPAVTPAGAALRASNRARRQRTPSPPTPRPVVSDTLRFVSLAPDAARELERGFQLSRVRVPRRVLADLGVLGDVHRDASGDAMNDAIDADVAFGQDGQARAIRLVPIVHHQ